MTEGHLNVIADDAFHYVSKTIHQYDVVFMDVFSDEAMPSHLNTEQFFASIHSHSFSEFRKSETRSFLALAVLSYILPHRNTVKAHLAKLYAQHCNSLRAALANIPAIALISDVWKNSRDLHFVSLTAHFRDVNFNLISLTIGFRQLVGNHITERRRKYRLYEITSLNI
ncbi:unnamed protein product [Rotaria sordida]|uniref:Transposase n=1 Tax=Rotaria sordida TaxID=392033 RepID=A0A813VIR6_9BILA|nr:unnamed protein product [Rotaria sordida]